jgi:prepilin-type N-terminal cleavage/methylation domain-containing protein
MEKRGFTLIEILIVLVIMGILIGLIWTAYAKANMAMKTGERRIDEMIASIEVIETVRDSLKTSVASLPFSFASDGIIFVSRRNDSNCTVSLKRETMNVWKLRFIDSNDTLLQPEKIFKAKLSLQFRKSDVWIDEWHEAEFPDFISLNVFPQDASQQNAAPYHTIIQIDPTTSAASGRTSGEGQSAGERS